MYTIIIYFKSGEDEPFYDITNYKCLNNTILRMVGADGRVIEFVMHNIAGYEIIPIEGGLND